MTVVCSLIFGTKNRLRADTIKEVAGILPPFVFLIYVAIHICVSPLYTQRKRCQVLAFERRAAHKDNRPKTFSLLA